MAMFFDVAAFEGRIRRRRGIGHCLRRRAQHGRGSGIALVYDAARPLRHGLRSYGRGVLLLCRSQELSNRDVVFPTCADLIGDSIPA